LDAAAFLAVAGDRAGCVEQGFGSRRGLDGLLRQGQLEWLGFVKGEASRSTRWFFAFNGAVGNMDFTFVRHIEAHGLRGVAS